MNKVACWRLFLYIDYTINRASYSAMLLRIILLDFSQLGCISSMRASLLIQPNQAVQCYLLLRCVMCEPRNKSWPCWHHSVYLILFLLNIFFITTQKSHNYKLFPFQMSFSIHLFHRFYFRHPKTQKSFVNRSIIHFLGPARPILTFNSIFMQQMENSINVYLCWRWTPLCC